ncbi:MAG: hypothetical protein Q8P56_03800 [Candidatus Uhrbacteria bacterium]|nr:hypothetical protein [Candidatus Uhrbacteria bacterium]
MTTCNQCNNEFEIMEPDKTFYIKVDAPEPTLCSECRQQRRLAFRNERTLYPRSCDSCKKRLVSIYPEQIAFPVYCGECWWSDTWEGTQYGIDYDSSVPFFDQFRELQSRVPRMSSLSLNSINSDYTNCAADNKNCYLISAADGNEDCYYGRLIQTSKNCVDCDYVYDSQRCYGSLDCRNCYNTLYCERCSGCTDVMFSSNLSGCSNCILCVNIRNKEYCIENEPVSKEEYEKRKNEILSSRESVEAARMRFEELKKSAIVKYADVVKCEQSTGDYLFNCDNTHYSFDATNAKDCAYVNDALDPIDFLDGNNIYYKPELCYEIMGCLKTYNCKFSAYIFYCSNVLYSDSCHNTNDSIGCIGLKKNQYCILNKQYAEEEYKKLSAEIIQRLKMEKIYGEFFPVPLSVHAYNETHAMMYYPLTKEEALQKGWRWSDAIPYTYGRETLAHDAIPPRIEDVPDDFTKEILACVHCGRNYRITPQELSFYRELHLPLPVMSPECRLAERQSRRKPRKLWTRQCMCEQTHQNHSGRCPVEFQTGYAPDRSERVYCEQCYQEEVV